MLSCYQYQIYVTELFYYKIILSCLRTDCLCVFSVSCAPHDLVFFPMYAKIRCCSCSRLVNSDPPVSVLPDYVPCV